jgi:arylsulfatase A-like enzyme
LPLVAVAALLVWAPACRQAAPRPSIVLAVLDTTRADAVSAYGKVAGTTPTVDALARQGVLYEYAYANANWTLPSHASLFTGLFPHQHGLLSSSGTLASAPTLAERLRDLGYETFAITENPWLMIGGMPRGFDRFLLSNGNTVGMLRDWVHGRKGDRPFLLFLNVMDAHEPYEVRESNPFLPPAVDSAQARATQQTPAHYVCASEPSAEDLAIVRGLYLGDVQAADAKLSGLLQALSSLPGADDAIVIVTSDHGEYLGEHARVGHVIGVHEPVVRIPLVVHGLPNVRSARIQAPVQLVDVLPSILNWIGAPSVPQLAGEPLPTVEPDGARTSPIVSEYDDYFRLNQHMPSFLRALKVNMEERCQPTQRMFGDMRAVIEFPRKVIWYSHYTTQLFDLRADPGEENDLAGSLPAATVELRSVLERVVAGRGAERRAAQEALNPETIERLRALGYFDHEER